MSSTEPQARLFAANELNDPELVDGRGGRLWLKIPHTWARLLFDEGLVYFLSSMGNMQRDSYGYFYPNAHYEKNPHGYQHEEDCEEDGSEEDGRQEGEGQSP